MKTPEKIKKGLECCFNEDNLDFACGECPYDEAGSECGDLFGDALAYIQQLEAKVPRWISVKESLPDKNGKYLVHAHHWLEGIEPIIKCSFYHSGKWDKCDAYIVDHWMPLPEPPVEVWHGR